MREYKKIHKEEEFLQKVICNRCGKSLKVEEGILREGCFHSEYPFDYFSSRDGYVYSFDLCENCFEDVIGEFQHPVQVREIKEFM